MGGESLVLLLLAACLAGVYVHHLRLNQAARQGARRYCEQHGLQLLDQSAILCGIRWTPRQGLRLTRRYQFEFSLAGDRRYSGWITLLGRRVVHTETQPVREGEFH